MYVGTLLRWGALAATLGCTASAGLGGSVPLCTPGMVASCPCLGGAPGVQACETTGAFGVCRCPDGGAPQEDVTLPPPDDSTVLPLDGMAQPGDVASEAAPADRPQDQSVEGGPPVDTSIPEDGAVRGPVFLSFGTNVTALTEGESVTFTAVLTDPDGSADLVGGALLDGGGAARFGAFMASGGTGSYGLTVTWAQIQAVSPIQFTGMESRTFLAEFFDAAGNRATRTVVLRLHCDRAGGSACEGRCRDLSSDVRNCGACSNSCALPTTRCAAGRCACALDVETPCGSRCVRLQTDPSNCGACGNLCRAPMNTCRAGMCACSVPGAVVCSGECVGLGDDVRHCGRCGQQCPAGQLCVDGACGTYVESFSRTPVSCDSVCGGMGRSCNTACPSVQRGNYFCSATNSYVYRTTSSCNATLPATTSDAAGNVCSLGTIYCCCGR